jgi:hypothetical protein
MDVPGSLAFFVSKKWKSTKSTLKEWNHRHFGRIQSYNKKLMSDINAIQSKPHSISNASVELNLQAELQEQLMREEILWKQKSREL